MPEDEGLLLKIKDLQTEVYNMKPKVVHQVIFQHTESRSVQKLKCT